MFCLLWKAEAGIVARLMSSATVLPLSQLSATTLSPLHRGLHLNGYLGQTHTLGPPRPLANFLSSKGAPKLRMTNISQAVVAHAFNPSTREAEAGGSL